MANLESTIKGLMFARENLCLTCSYDDLIDNALSLLREARPRVLRADELSTWHGAAVWLETKNGAVYTGWALVYDHITSGMNGLLPGERIGLTRPGGRVSWLLMRQYGRQWRCWTSPPTAEQMEVVRWT